MNLPLQSYRPWCQAVIFCAATLGQVALFGGIHAEESSLVYPGQAGRLLYATQADGDRIMDFSRVGYRFGEVDIPDVAGVVTVSPADGDDFAAIQAAIQQVESQPLDANGFRGAVVFEPGEYQSSGRITIRKSGVVLRGAGDDPVSGTRIRSTFTTRGSLIYADPGGSANGTISGPTVNLIDKYVPVGATSFRVDNPGNFSVGDHVLITRPGTQQWISDLGMDRIPPRNDGREIRQWEPEDYNLDWERHVTRVEGDRVFIDSPLSNSIEQQYGDGTIQHFSFPQRIDNVGVEGIRGISNYDTSDPTDEDHAWNFIDFKRVEHGWVRDVTGQHFALSTVILRETTTNITVQDAHSVDPISQITGARRYAFNTNGAENNLFRDMTSDKGRHDFVTNSPSEGPNVFLNGVATNAFSDTGPHQRWSTGALFDNIDVSGNNINVQNRGNFGSGHGWAGGNMVIWNSQADAFIVQNPPTAQNWLIGSIGTIQNSSRHGQQEPGIYDQHGAHVDTSSLYLKQLEDRLAASNGQNYVYVLGDYDNYTNDGQGSVDEMPVSANLFDEFGDFFDRFGHPLNGQDDLTNNQFIPQTFNFGVADDEQVFHAVLTVAIKKTGGQTTNDSFLYERRENRTLFSDFGITSEISSSESTMLLLEFTGTDLGWFNDGQFDFVIGEDIAVDWSKLELYIGDLLQGDVNADGVLSIADVAAFADALDAKEERAIFEESSPTGRYLAGDFSGDGMVTFTDYEAFRQAILTVDPLAEEALDALIPEPSAVLVLTSLGSMLIIRREVGCLYVDSNT